jgi:hypothetical protein
VASITEELLILIKSLGGAVAAEDVEKVAGASSKSGKEAKKATEEHKGFGAALSSLKSIAFQTAGLAGIGGIAVGVGEAIKSAQAMQDSTVQLAGAIKNNVRYPARDATQQMKDFADSLSIKGGFAATESVQGMTRLLGVTKSVGGAERDMTLATDVARRTHLGLAQATRAVMMVEAGRTTGLSRMGIFVNQVKTAEDALTAAGGKHTAQQKEAAKIQDQNATRIQGMTALWKTFGGATAGYSRTSAGAINDLRHTVDVFEERLGEKLLPTVTRVTQAFTHFVSQMMAGKGTGGEVVSVAKQLFGALKDVFGVLKDIWPVLAALTAIWGTYTAYTKAAAFATRVMKMLYIQTAVATEEQAAATESATVAQAELNATMALNPIALVIIAIAALVAGLMLLWKHCAAFRDFWKGMWKDVKVAAAAVVDWLVEAWGNTVQWVANAARNAERWIVGAFHDVIKWLQSNWPYVLGVLTGPIGLAVAWIYKHWDTVKQLPSDFLKLLKGIAGPIFDAIKWPFEQAFKWVSHHLPTFHVHHVGPVPIPLPSFPGLAAGGITPYSGAFVVGERGPELVTLPQGANVSSQSDLQETNTLLKQLIVVVQQNTRTLVVDGRVLAQAVNRQALLQQARA